MGVIIGWKRDEQENYRGEKEMRNKLTVMWLLQSNTNILKVTAL